MFAYCDYQHDHWVCGYRNLWTRKARTLLTIIGIVLGVATVFAISITESIVRKREMTKCQKVSYRRGLAGECLREALSSRGLRRKNFNRDLARVSRELLPTLLSDSNCDIMILSNFC